MLIYLDTSAWNSLLPWASRHSMRYFEDCEVLFSSSNLDEIALASHYRARELADLAWRISNTRQLCDHVLLTIREIGALVGRAPGINLYRDDPKFDLIWQHLREGGLTTDQRDLMSSQTRSAKGLLKEWLRQARAEFALLFRACADVGVRKPWSEMLREIEDEGYIHRQIRCLLLQEGEDRLAELWATRPPNVYKELPGTAAWVQYYTALPFLAAYESGKLTRPDTGDQADFRHAAYAGYADVFVTDDDRMTHVLGTMVRDKKCTLVSTQKFTSYLEGREPL